jgi:DNA-binding transcriptional LysR family regulator
VGLNQPATSFALAKLRPLLNDPLFVRTPQGMQPTPQALALAQPIRQALNLIRNDVLQRRGLDLPRTTRRFTIAMTDVAEMVFLPRLLRLLKEEAPLATLKTVTTSFAELEIALETGTVDLAVGLFPHLKRASFYQQKIFQHPFVCIVRSDHPTIGRRMTLQQFLEASQRRVMLSISHFLSIPMVIATSDLVVAFSGTCSRDRPRFALFRRPSRSVIMTSANIGMSVIIRTKQTVGFERQLRSASGEVPIFRNP